MMNDTTLKDADDYYAWLGLSREATSEEIQAAYRRMSRAVHPDKHSVSEEARSKANHIFTKIKRAYEVLSDPQKRAIYDTVGEKGLQTEGWQVVTRQKTPAEILQEFENLRRHEEELRLQRSTHPVCDVVVEVDAADLLQRHPALDDSVRLPMIELTGLTVHTSVNCPLSERDTVVINADLSSENGQGTGSITTSYTRVHSASTWTETSFTMGTPTVLNGRCFCRLWQNLTGSIEVAMRYQQGAIIPVLAARLEQQLSRHVQGKMSIMLRGLRPVLQTSVSYSAEELTVTALAQLHTLASFLRVSVAYRVPDFDLVLKANARLGMLGWRVECGCSQKVTEFSTITASVSIAVPEGVKLNLKLLRGNQSFSMRITLCDEVLAEPVVYGVLVPAVTYLVVRALIVRPFLKDRKDRELQRKKEANATVMAEQKREAEATMELLHETVERSYRVEEERSGLLIRKALYGKMSGEGEATSEQEVINVTKQLQAQVQDSRLVLLPSVQLSQLPGFYDPCVGEDKYLVVTYHFRGQLHVCRHKQGTKIVLPSREHLCPETMKS